MSYRKNLRLRFESRWIPEPFSGCWLWFGGQRSTGYGAFKIGYLKDGTRHMDSAHRVSWMIYRGEIPVGKCVLHRCDVRLCVNPDHLFLGTLTDNNRDMARKGRLKGRRSKPLVFNESLALAIRNDPRKQRVIAEDYGISQSNVSLIKRQLTWKGIA